MRSYCALSINAHWLTLILKAAKNRNFAYFTFITLVFYRFYHDLFISDDIFANAIHYPAKKVTLLVLTFFFHNLTLSLIIFYSEINTQNKKILVKNDKLFSLVSKNM